MSDRYKSLLEALDWSVKKITDCYAINWIFTGDKDIDSVNDSSIPHNMNEHYYKVFDPEIHNCMEMCICLSGSFAMQLNDHITDIAAGKVCLILPGVLHRELPKNNCSYEAIWINMYFNTISMHLSGRNCEDGLFYTTDGYSIKTVHDCGFFIKNIIDEVTGKASYFYDLIKSNVQQLLLLILRMIKDQVQNKNDIIPWKEKIALQVQQYIQRNYSNVIRLNDVSHELSISPNYLNTIFKSVTGKTIIQYMEEYRIEKAKLLLNDNKYSLGNISESLGYYDQYHFSKIFKKATGYSPTEYKKAFINADN